MRGSYGGSGFGGMLGGMRGLTAGSMSAPNMDNLTDEGVVGSAYDQKVVLRLATYIGAYKKDAIKAVVAVLIYTLSSVSIPFFLLYGVNWAINDGDVSRLHLLGLAFLVMTVILFGSNYLQFIYIPRVGQGILFSLRTQMFSTRR